MRCGRTYRWTRMHRHRALFRELGTFFAVRSWAGCITNMFGFDLRQAQVVHIHCVDTIALAVRADAEAAVAERLRGSGGIEWSLVPYRRPGLPLAKAIGATMKSGANVLVLANHGLVVAGQSVSEVAERLDRVCRAFAAKPRNAPRADLTKLEKAVEGSAYRLPTSAR